MTSRNGRTYYVSWISLRNDPWPDWDCTGRGEPARMRDGSVLPLLPADDPNWPGVPVRKKGDQRVTYTGPTITALFHERSDYYNLRNLHRIYLLHQADHVRPDCQEYLKEIVEGIIEARKGTSPPIDPSKISWVSIRGIEDPTDHEQIMSALKGWINSDDDPFDFSRPGIAKRVEINIGAGTQSMHACWMMLRWSGAFRDLDVQFFQGDGGLSIGKVEDDTSRKPNRYVPFDELTRYVRGNPRTAASPPHPDEKQRVKSQLEGAGYEVVRQHLEAAAWLGLPILLEGERGSGKTDMAKYFHYLREEFHDPRPRATEGKFKDYMTDYDGPTRVARTGQFVPVILSEFSEVQELRDHLFGWTKGAFTGATGYYDGLLGDAHDGTLFLDEVHHLDRTLQAALLGPMNDGKYRPKMASYRLTSKFSLVVATNDPGWERSLDEDFRDRIKRIVVHIPSFKEIRDKYPASNPLEGFWDATFTKRCAECNVPYVEPDENCRAELRIVLKHKPLKGNWRDLQRLADQVLLNLVKTRGGHPALQWDHEVLKTAVEATFS